MGRSPGGGHGNTLQYSCLENPHGQKSLVGYSPSGHKELDMTEQLSTALILIQLVLVEGGGGQEFGGADSAALGPHFEDCWSRTGDLRAWGTVPDIVIMSQPTLGAQLISVNIQLTVLKAQCVRVSAQDQGPCC